jgi:hypothetical protein
VVFAALCLFLGALMLTSAVVGRSWLNAVIGINTYRTARMRRRARANDDRDRPPRFRGDD